MLKKKKVKCSYGRNKLSATCLPYKIIVKMGADFFFFFGEEMGVKLIVVTGNNMDQGKCSRTRPFWSIAYVRRFQPTFKRV